jgi:hypothetical protein
VLIRCYDFSSLFAHMPISDCFPKSLSYSLSSQPRHLPFPLSHLFLSSLADVASPSSLSWTMTHCTYLLIFLSPISCTALRLVAAGLSQAFLVFNLS